MAYRAPELFDVQSNITIEKNDIWSLGCLYYAMTYGESLSPFEVRFDHDIPKPVEVSYLRVIGRINFPINSSYSNYSRNLIQKILIKDPQQRMNIDQLINTIDETKRIVEKNIIINENINKKKTTEIV